MVSFSNKQSFSNLLSLGVHKVKYRQKVLCCPNYEYTNANAGETARAITTVGILPFLVSDCKVKYSCVVQENCMLLCTGSRPCNQELHNYTKDPVKVWHFL